MATYIDERDAAIAAIQALIAPNGVGAITGQVHQDNEVGQTEDAYLNLVGYDNFGFVIVRTGIDPATGTESNTAAQNGANLLAAYANASALTPNGQPLSATNRAAVLLPPGVYDFNVGKLTMNTQFVDIIGLGAAEDVVVSSSYGVNDGTGTITKSCNNAIIKNISILNAAPAAGPLNDQSASGFAPQGVYSNEVLDGVVFMAQLNSSPYMRQDVEYAGTYTNCKVSNSGVVKFVMFPGATGTFKNCDAVNDYGFGYSFPGWATGSVSTSGQFYDCKCYSGFGAYQSGDSGAVVGLFVRCTATENSFGFGSFANSATFEYCKSGDFSFTSDGLNSGVYVGCEGVNNCFSSVTDNFGAYKNCRGSGSGNFGGNDNYGQFNDCYSQSGFFAVNDIKANSSFVNCSAFANSFYGNGVNAGTYSNCTSGGNSFLADTDLSGNFYKCTSTGIDSFDCPATISGRFEFCSSVANSFGGGLGASQTVTATFIECSSGAGSFNANISTGTNGGTYIGCTAGNDSFNGKNISYVAEKCTAGNNSFGYSSTSVNPILFNAAKLSYCKAGINSFGFSSWLDSATEFKYCEGGNLCFGVSNGGPGQTTAAKFYHCKGGDFCFGVGVQGPRGTGPGPAIAAEFYNCVGGNKCFGVGNGIELAGVCVNCTAGNWSFGSSENNPLGAWATATGKFYNCRAGNNSFGASSGSNGGAVASGQFYKCVAGAGSFGSNNGASTSGDDSFASGYFEDCTGGYRSFAGHGRAFKSGFFLRCIVLGDSPSTPVIDDLGALIENGVMEDCVWRVNNATAKALLVQNTSGGTPAPRVLGGKYIAGSGANFAIGSGGGSPQAVIAQIRSNGGSSGLIESTITNLAASGTIDAADNFTYTGL